MIDLRTQLRQPQVAIGRWKNLLAISVAGALLAKSPRR